MNEYNDMDYYRTRTARERELAGTSADASVARIHREMAERYEKMIESGQTDTALPAHVGDAR